jgi:16S rRNA (cytidine1402-2'-O)-methyltransferase
MAGTLYLVATPIGNLEDVTIRALRILKEVAVIAAEDTRRTSHLLARYGISTPMTSLHEHNEHHKAPRLLERLQAGESLALVSDAGTPAVSDPGQELVTHALAAGIRVDVIPGPSAVLAALLGSGFSFESFAFVGFPPTRSKARKEWLTSVAAERRPVVLFEAPHRIAATLADAADLFGNRPIAIGRELTKAHEEWVRGPILEVLERLGEPRGEFTIVVGPAAEADRAEAPVVDAREVYREFGEMTENSGMPRRAIIQALARRFSLPSREVYRMVEAQHRADLDR